MRGQCGPPGPLLERHEITMPEATCRSPPHACLRSAPARPVLVVFQARPLPSGLHGSDAVPRGPGPGWGEAAVGGSVQGSPGMLRALLLTNAAV